MNTYTIGRSDSQDIVFDEPTVSRKHAEIVITESGVLFLTDCGSSLGTRLARNGEWNEFKQSFLKKDDIILLGRFEVTVLKLIEHAIHNKIDFSNKKLERNARSGELGVKGK